jgi:hypothetical protein
MKRFIVMATLVSLTGCTFTHPIKGIVDKTHERFIGTATASLLEKNATIDIVTDMGAKCSGIYPRPESTSSGVSASGSFECNDGRVGNFVFSGTAQGGEGFGKFKDGNKFRFIYGADNSQTSDASGAALAAGLSSIGEGLKAQQPVAAPTYPVTQPLRGPIHCSTANTGLSTTILETNCY